MKDNFRVWWCTSGTITRYYVENIENAKLIINALIIREEDDESIVWNAHGLEKINEYDQWEEYYDEDGLNIEEIMDQEDEHYNYMLRGE